VIRVAFDLAAEQAPVAALLRQYADVPMSLADACLVRMSELAGESVVFTIDSDFRVYRRHRRQKVPLRMPPDA
jgi:predicted nucleic acid-binding protein